MQDFSSKRFIFGAGRHAEETFYLLQDIGAAEEVTGFIIDEPGIQESFLGRALISTEVFLTQYALQVQKPSVLVAIGNITANKKFTTLFEEAGYAFFSAIAEGIPASRQRHIGKGVTIATGTILTSNISIGDFSIINIGCTISHDVSIGKNVNISPGVHVAGNVMIEDEVFIGIGASIIPGISIGKRSVIAAGACVTKDVPASCLVAGVPAQIKKHNPLLNEPT